MLQFCDNRGQDERHGGAAAFASTLAVSGLVPRMDRTRSYLPFAAYRVALGAVALLRLNGGDGR